MTPSKYLERAGLKSGDTPIQLSGGDMGVVWRTGSLVIKTTPHGQPEQLETEARGLVHLAQKGGRTPAVHYVDHECLIIDYIDSASANWPDLAAQLARIHQPFEGAYGSDERVFIGRLPLSPTPRARDWSEFWYRGRIEPLLTLTSSTLGPLANRIRRVMDSYHPPTEGPCLLHGDLWNGNVVMGGDGAYLIDPSVWVGERSVDLAMMRLFGGFPQQFWSCYQDLYPIPAEVIASLPFHQLYFLLVHVHFFGSTYCSGVQRVVEHYGC